MATKKPTPKKAPAKPVAKKTAPKPAAKKPVAKAVLKKVVAKPTTKKVTHKTLAKPAAKKVVSKPVVKPTVKRPVAKKVIAKKVVAKKVVVKQAVKPAIKKAITSKTIVKKVVAKPVIKPIVKKAATKIVPKKVTPKVKPEAKKATVVKPVKVVKPIVEKPVKAPKPVKPAKKPAHTKTIIASTYNLPKKSDVFKTSTFSASNLKNETGKVIAHRKTSELKRKAIDTSIKKYSPEQARSILDMNTNTATSYRYSDDDLQEFRELITQKIETAKNELQYLQGVIMRKDEGGTEDTENKYQGIEDGSAAMDREQFNQLASRQITFISHLEQAMVRIENKTYGICRETGKLIDKARLRAVPHATLSIEAKNAKKN